MESPNRSRTNWRRLIAPVGTCVLTAYAFVGVLSAERFTARVVSVIDGDTVGVLRDGQEVRIRLEGIDCPENGQDFGNRAKQFTSDLIFGRTVDVDVRDVDQYGRLVSRVMVDGRDVSVALVEAGLAWHYTQYSKDPVLAKAEASARAKRIGLWVQSNAVPPWTYRRPAAARESPRPPPPARPALWNVVFHGNSQSKVLHAPRCQHYECDHCTRRFTSIAEAEAAGYRKHSGNGGCID
jgi:endonuclease YncB( thermonuclease family)